MINVNHKIQNNVENTNIKHKDNAILINIFIFKNNEQHKQISQTNKYNIQTY